MPRASAAAAVAVVATDRRHRRSAVRSSGRSAVWASARTDCFSWWSGVKRLQAARGAEHHDRGVFLVFRCGGHLILGQIERDAVALVGDAAEMQRVPVDHDFATADAEKAT